MGPLGHSIAALAALMALPVGLVGCALRPRWRAGLRERLGATPSQAAGGLWIHAASIGETRAAASLLPSLRSRGVPLLLTHSSLGARGIDDPALAGVARALAPLDHPWCVAAGLRAARPRAIVLVESEIWPCWIAAATERSIPVVVVSGRISAEAFARYHRAGRLLAGTFGRLCAVGARSDEDAERFVALGVPAARVERTGDLKLEAPGAAAGLADDLAAVLGERALWVAGSTHPGEEVLVAEAQALLRSGGAEVGLAVAPRLPERAGTVRAELERCGLRVRRRTRLGTAPLADDEVLLIDTLGELPSLYGRARFAFVGGSFAPVGGHNLLEPVHRGAPVLFGPGVGDVRDAAAWLEGCGAGARVDSAEALAAVALRWLRDPAELERCREAGRTLLAAHQGSAARSLALLEGVAPLGAPEAA